MSNYVFLAGTILQVLAFAHGARLPVVFACLGISFFAYLAIGRP